MMDDIIDPDAEKMNIRFSVSSYPVLLLVDKKGIIAYRIDGYGGEEEFNKLDEILSQRESK